jgi:predicted nucleic acid-binding protein
VSDVVIDTDVASAILKGQLPDTLARQLAGQRLAVTFVTVGELTQWTYLHRSG